MSTSFREKIKRVFSRSASGPSQRPKDSSTPSSKPKGSRRPSQSQPPNKPATIRPPIGVKPGKIKYRSNGKPKIELYKEHEIPRSKYRGPFDEEHIKRLAAYTISSATTGSDRPRSFVSELSPMGTRAPSRRQSAENTRSDGLGVEATIGNGYLTMSEALASVPSSAGFPGDGHTYAPVLPAIRSAVVTHDVDLGSDTTSVTTAGALGLDQNNPNISSSTLLTFQTDSTLAPPSGTATSMSANPHPVPEKIDLASSPVPSHELTEALRAIQLRP
ncbi:hypothetical protein FQN53_003750 [Emmonsiellopsis sp. PD_33]|nr:hypothetical protein FQN53_003750 [Emmonsiellopsis sp. PD_33]